MPPEQTNSPRLGSVLGKQLSIFLAYFLITLGIIFFLPGVEMITMWLLAAYIIHAIVLFIYAIVSYNRGNTALSAALALSGILIIIIGFGACTGTFMSGAFNFF